MRILGLDIGSSSVKAIELNAGFGRFDVLEYHEYVVPSETPPLQVARDLVMSLKKRPDKIVTNLKSNRVTIRNIKLPTRDKKAIQSSIQFELEDDLPFESENLAYEYVNLGTVGSETSIHVAATTKANVAELIALMDEYELHADVLTTEACAYRALFRKISSALPQSDRPVLLINIGHERSTISIQNNGNPLLCREVNWGSREISVALSKRYNLTLEAAEKAKVESGFVLPLSQLEEVSEEQRDFAATVYESLISLIRDVKQADLSCKNLTGNRVGQVYLSGPTALMPGMAATFAEELKVGVSILRPLSSLGSSGVTYSEQTDVRFALALGLALSFVSSERSALINFRRGEFSKRSIRTADVDLSAAIGPLKIAFVTFLLATGILFVETTLYDERLTQANAQLERAIRSYFSGISPGAVKNHLNNTSGLRKSIDGEVARERQLSKLFDPDPASPFEFLKGLSGNVPKDVVTDLMKFSVGASPEKGEPPTELEFWVTNPQVAERLKTLIMTKYPDLSPSPISEITTKDGLKKLKISFMTKGAVKNGK
jgi:type IV pilus assembly protein PilM